jgi:hypothetical protein
MGIPVIIDVPEPVYEQATEIAASTRRGVGEVLQELFIRSFPPMYDGGEAFDAMVREVDAFEAMHTELWKKYPEQFVAIYGGKVVDFDHDEWALICRIEEKYPDDVVMIDQVKPTFSREIVFHSPRFVFEA